MVMKMAEHVSIVDTALSKFASEIIGKKEKLFEDFEQQDFHYCNVDQPESVVDYVFVLDALNFCFWPVKPMGYKDLAQVLKEGIEADPSMFKPANIRKLSYEDFKTKLFKGKDFHLMEERY